MKYSKILLTFCTLLIIFFINNNYLNALASPSNTTNAIDQNKIIDIKGEITVLQIDDFKNPEKSHLEYYIDTSNGKYPIYFSSNDNIVSGSIINTKGLKINNKFFVDNIKDNNPNTNNNTLSVKNFISGSTGNQRVLVLLIKSFPEDTEPVNTQKIRDFIFNGQFQNFMKEQSYGKISFTGDVYGWISYNSPLLDNCIRLNEEQLKNVVDTYKIDLANYDRIVYLIKDINGGCSIIGKSNVYVKGNKYLLSQSSIGLSNYDSPSDWGSQSFSWTNLDFLLSHEMGHSLGISHANSWYCNNTILYGDCNHVEYGNRFDAMGFGMYSLNYNTYFKEKLNWINNQQILYITKSGTYTISNLESTSSIKMAKIYIDKPDTRITVPDYKLLASSNIQTIGNKVNPYFIEYRRPIGFDSKLNDTNILQNSKGIFINRVQENDSLSTELLDMSPFNGYTLDQVTLNATSTKTSVDKFVDNGNGVVIGPIINISTSSITFNVEIKEPKCERTAPNIRGIYANRNVFLGDSIVLNIDVNNSESYLCGYSNFSASLKSPNWKSQSFPNPYTRIPPNSNGNVSLIVDIPTNITPDTYFLSIEIRSNNGMKKTIDYPIKVKQPLSIEDINPKNGPKGTKVIIKGKGFDNNTGNFVNLNSKNGWSDYIHIESINNILIYKIPDIINHCMDIQCTQIKKIPIPEGDYNLGVMVNGIYIPKIFHVGFPLDVKPNKPINTNS